MNGQITPQIIAWYRGGGMGVVAMNMTNGSDTNLSTLCKKFEIFIVDFTRPEALSKIFKVLSKEEALFRLGQTCYLKVFLWLFILQWCSCLFIAEKITCHMASYSFWRLIKTL
jgi:hypothetical protein